MPPAVPSARRLEVLSVYAATGSYKLAAQRLGISPCTVRQHLADVRRHYGVERSIQALSEAIRRGDLEGRD